MKGIESLIGNTPAIELTIDGVNVQLKMESKNLTGSVKVRPVYNMILEAERQGLLKKGSTIIEPTSGNTGIAMAMLGRLKGYKVIIAMPESMSDERKKEIKSYGAELLLTEASGGMPGAIKKVEDLVKENQSYVYLNQFDNAANPAAHYKTTGKEILKQSPNLKYFIAGIGTGGTITGVGKRLKEESSIKIYGIEPEESAVISGEESGGHKIQGIGAGFIPKNLDTDVLDGVIKVSSEEAFEMTKKIRDQYGLLVGLSTGANVVGAIKLAKTENITSGILTINCDIGERYLSTNVFL